MTGDQGHEPAGDGRTRQELDDAESRVRDDLRQHAYRLALGAAVVMLAIATVVYRVAEDWSWVDSFYFSAVAVTTVGFGDLTPTTDFSKLFTVFYIFFGIALVGSVLSEALRRHAARVGERRGSRRDR